MEDHYRDTGLIPHPTRIKVKKGTVDRDLRQPLTRKKMLEPRKRPKKMPDMGVIISDMFSMMTGTDMDSLKRKMKSGQLYREAQEKGLI
jgi:hypothetical protein